MIVVDPLGTDHTNVCMITDWGSMYIDPLLTDQRNENDMRKYDKEGMELLGRSQWYE